jgi:hypothetical protein
LDLTRETPSFTEFDPNHIKWQIDAIHEIDQYDYSLGLHEILLSGSIGSAKSLFMAHCCVRHVVEFTKARALIGRLTMPDLKDTLIDTIKDHMEGDFIEGEDYEFSESKQKWTFENGSEIISRAWHKKRFGKFRSLKISAAFLEELTENKSEHWPFYDAIKQRIGRLPHIKENILMSATNPDGPEHPAYKHFMIEGQGNPKRHVYYSVTTDNPFLPEWYVKNLIEDLDPDEVQRMIYGRWLSINRERVYYNFDTQRNFRNEDYIVDLNYPIDLMFDFNIGLGKPMSAAAGQYINGVFHTFKTFIVHGADTHEILQEIADSGVLEKDTNFRVFGDASGRNRDTRSKKNDYDIIDRFLRLYMTKEMLPIEYELRVPRSNPKIRERHNTVNARFLNGNKKVAFYAYKDAKACIDGFLNTKLKKGGSYIEDDSYEFQHVTTAIGYWIMQIKKDLSSEQRATLYKAR